MFVLVSCLYLFGFTVGLLLLLLVCGFVSLSVLGRDVFVVCCWVLVLPSWFIYMCLSVGFKGGLGIETGMLFVHSGWW